MNDADPPGLHISRIDFYLAAVVGSVATWRRLRFRLRIHFLKNDVWPSLVAELTVMRRVAVKAHGRRHLGTAYRAATSFLIVIPCLVHNSSRFIECEHFLFFDEFLHVLADFLTYVFVVYEGSPAHFEVMLSLEVLSNFILVLIPHPFML